MLSLSNYWISNRQLWFNSTPETDYEIVQNTYKYLNFGYKESELNIYNIEMVNKLDPLCKIIFYDQIIRHYVRHFNFNIDLSNKIIEDNSEKAIIITKELIENKDIYNYVPVEQCFILMPYRHSKNEEYRIQSIKIIEELLESNPKNSDYIRFYQASLERVRNPKLINTKINTPINADKFPQYLVCASSQFNINTFLDTSYSNITISDIPPEFINGFHKAIPINNDNNNNNNNNDNTYPEITVSISGGSDSMLCLFIASKMGYKVKALMIDYCNRNEHLDEIDFVEWFCNKLGVDFYVRNIPELKRERDSTRNFYEDITKKIRFRSYKFLNNPVILGHNLDDCFENCITNIMTQRSKDNLFGMSEISEQLGVSLRRPMLNIPKSRIVEICNKFNIPYLLDSTPKWSRRGKIRDIIVPALNTFDINLIPRIMEFCNESSKSLKDYQSLLETYPIKESVYKTRTKTQKQYIIDMMNPLNEKPVFWQGIINKITDNEKITRIRISTIESMISNIKKELNNQHNKNEISISLSPQLKMFINDTRTLIMFRLQN
jgi:tRNA(Ile)-lysidine synthetase-like protein